MYCPKCASPAVEGQRFCRQCGTNLGVIVDAMEGRRGQVDFERVKADLKDLGTSLRSGFEQVQQEFRKKQNEQRHRQHEQQSDWISSITQTASTAANDVKTALFSTPSTPKPSKAKRSRESRRYHLQKGILSIFTGSASAGAYYWLLQTATESGLLANLEQLVLQRNPHLTGLVPVAQMLWVFCLIPVATGMGHLINGAFFTSPDQELKANENGSLESSEHVAPSVQQSHPPQVATVRDTNEINPDLGVGYSVTEDATLPLDQARRERQAS